MADLGAIPTDVLLAEISRREHAEPAITDAEGISQIVFDGKPSVWVILWNARENGLPVLDIKSKRKLFSVAAVREWALKNQISQVSKKIGR